MPIYEYYCPDNNRVYQFFAKTLAQGQTIPPCPDNPEYRMVRVPSAFAIGGATRKSRQGEKGAAPGAAGDDEGGGGRGGDDDAGGGEPGGPDDARMDAAMAELERAMDGVDEDDPRQMGRMMRRMAELTGEPLEGEMEEMVRKLEEGTDPEKLEEAMGDAFGEGGDGDDDDPYGMGGGFGGGRRSPSRDPHLYDY